jgi:hypothetical protein
MKLMTVDNTVKTSVLGFRDISSMAFSDTPKCWMIRLMISVGARKIDKKMLTFLEFPRRNTSGTLLVQVYIKERKKTLLQF